MPKMYRQKENLLRGNIMTQEVIMSFFEEVPERSVEIKKFRLLKDIPNLDPVDQIHIELASKLNEVIHHLNALTKQVEEIRK